MDIIPVSFVVAPFRMVHCVNPEYVFVHCPLTTASMLTNTTATYERILWIPAELIPSFDSLKKV